MRGKNENEAHADRAARSDRHFCADIFYFRRNRSLFDFRKYPDRMGELHRPNSTAHAVALGSGVERGDLRDAADRRRALFCPVALWRDEASAVAMDVEAAA